MSRAVLLAIILILIGAGGYVATSMASVTALIPAFFGLAILAVQKIGAKAGIVTIILAILGMAGAARGLPGFFKWVSGESVERPAAVLCQALMFIACLVYVALSFRKGK